MIELAGQGVAVVGKDGPLGAEILRALLSAGGDQVDVERADTLVFAIAAAEAESWMERVEGACDAVADLIPAMRLRVPPRTVVVVEEEADDTASASLAASLVRYLQAHMGPRAGRINLLRVRPSSNELAAARATVALASGWMDAVGGQDLVLTERVT
jgi:hypothetical protein